MEIVSCSVRLAGDNNHVVEKTDVTVAEIAILQHIHGLASITNIRRTGMDRRPHREERERLRLIYNRREKIVDKIYPNIPGAKLPVSLSDIDLSMAGGNAPGEEAEVEVAEEELPKITAANVRRVPAPVPVSDLTQTDSSADAKPTTLKDVPAAGNDDGSKASAADVLDVL
jgi:hypothetical protein